MNATFHTRVAWDRFTGSTQSSICMYPGERFNTCTHLLGLVLAILGLPAVLAHTLPGRDTAKIIGGLAFALSCIGLYAASTLFHGTRGQAKLRWQRVDHCAIYFHIAGSYTPFALITLHGAWAWILMVTAWGTAAFGIWRELQTAPAAKPSLVLYVGMGWAGLVVAGPLATHIETGGLIWLLVGAVLYTAGTIFYVNRAGYRHAHGVWHLFVLGGTTCHYAAIAGFVL